MSGEEAVRDIVTQMSDTQEEISVYPSPSKTIQSKWPFNNWILSVDSL